MARASTTSDAFNAIAEPRRREILVYLAMRERPVGEIVESLGMISRLCQSICGCCATSAWFRVRCDGRHKLYQTNAEGIRPLHEWAGTFERYWTHQLNRVKERAEEKAVESQQRILNVRISKEEDMITTAQSLEDLTLNMTQEIHVKRILDATF